MSSISNVSGSSYYSQIASGVKLQSAADGASELAIAEKENAQINGLNMGQRYLRPVRQARVFAGDYPRCRPSLRLPRSEGIYHLLNTAVPYSGH